MSAIDTPQPVYIRYLDGGGEMGKLTRQFNWAGTALGTPDKWPQSLLTTLSTLLNSKFPMFLFWGDDLIQFYNDAYRPSLGASGKHPEALGARAADCWPELFAVIKPIIDNVRAGGESVLNEDQLVPIYRNGSLEDAYWTFCYSPVRGDEGEIAGVLSVCTETTGNIVGYRVVNDTKKELEQAIEAAELGTWDLDPKTHRFIGNNRLKHWFGLEPEDEIDLTAALNSIIEADRDHVASAIEKAMQRGSDGNYSIIYTIVSQKDGVRRVVKANGKALFDDEGEPYRFSGVLEDVTDDYQLQQRKDEFISVASHELKTPITTLNASMQILQKLIRTDPQSEKVPFFVDKANNNLHKLVRLLDDLLNVTRIQQGQLAINKTMFNMVDLVKDCSEHVQMDGNHHVSITGDTELMVFADYRRIDQVLVNLINNAVKYAPQSKRIEIHIEHDADNARVSVRDFGIGINPEKLPHLFDRYYRVDALGHQFSGLGLGLYICSEIINRHNGEIGVESNWGEGSKFWFSIPING